METKVEDPGGNSMTLLEWDGTYYPAFPGFEERMKNFANFKVRPDDILVASYPKCGTHWIVGIISRLLGNTEKVFNSSVNPNFLERGDGASDMASPRVMFTHLHHRHMPEVFFKSNTKIVHIYRNPKDIAVSCYHFVKKIKLFRYSGTWNGFYQLFKTGKSIYGSWHDYTLTWWEKEKNNPMVHFVSYEGLKNDCLSELKRIASFLEIDSTEATLKEVEKHCSFSTMKERESGTQGQDTMYRKGEVGDWKNYFTVSQNEAFDILHQEKMKDSDLPVHFEI